MDSATKQKLLSRAQQIQARGTAALANAPAPLRRALRDTSVRFRAEDGPTQSIASPQSRDANLAGVVQNDPRTINVMDQAAFEKAPAQLAAHEGMHLWQNSLPAPLQKAIPPDDPNNPYKLPSTDDVATILKRGGKITDLPKEQQSVVAQYYVAQGGDKSAPDEVRNTYGKLLGTMNSVPQSLIQGTDPDSATINTTPRTPLPPTDVPGAVQPMQKVFPEKKASDKPKVDLSAGFVKKDITKHPAGKVTAIDEESGLPIVRRHGSGHKDEAKPTAHGPQKAPDNAARPTSKPAEKREETAAKSASTEKPIEPAEKPKKPAGGFGSMLAKGQIVHLNNGISGKVQHVSSSMKIARIKTRDGRNLTVRHSQISAVENAERQSDRSNAETAATA